MQLKPVTFFLLFLTSFTTAGAAHADTRDFFIRLDASTIAQGYTVSVFDDAFKLSLVPGILSEQTGVQVREIGGMDEPWKLQRISPIYEFEFLNKAAYDNSHPFYIELKTDRPSPHYKQVFFYDKNYDAWRPLPTRDHAPEQFVRSLIHLPYARIAVFAYPDMLIQGEASWYRHKRGLFAASPDFPQGSRLRVHNLASGSFVDVTVNDYGPDRGAHPSRAIDLDRVAFTRLAPPGAGLITVRVEPLEIVPQDKAVLGILPEGIAAQPHIESSAAIVIDENSGKTLYEKNADEPLSIASLTKLIAAAVFLETEPDLEQIVEYRVQDEEYNYRYAHTWEVVRLSLRDGETISIRDLLTAALVGSANNAVETLVRVSGVSRDTFIAKMNEYAQTHGALSLSFDDPAGLSPKNVSSARDYARAALAALANPVIQKTSTLKNATIATRNTSRSLTVKNTHPLLNTSRYTFEGFKIGYLHEARNCVVAKVPTQSSTLIVVVLGDASRNANAQAAEKLIRFARARAERTHIAQIQ